MTFELLAFSKKNKDFCHKFFCSFDKKHNLFLLKSRSADGPTN